MAATLSKEERLSGKTAVKTLVSEGRWGAVPHVKYCYSVSPDRDGNRIVVSVPKKFFKRAVKRNLLKRRMREAYRTQKGLLDRKGVDVMFVYASAEIVKFEVIREEIAGILSSIK